MPSRAGRRRGIGRERGDSEREATTNLKLTTPPPTRAADRRARSPASPPGRSGRTERGTDRPLRHHGSCNAGPTCRSQGPQRLGRIGPGCSTVTAPANLNPGRIRRTTFGQQMPSQLLAYTAMEGTVAIAHIETAAEMDSPLFVVVSCCHRGTVLVHPFQVFRVLVIASSVLSGISLY